MKPFDERLYALKIQEPSRRMQAETEVRRRHVHAEQQKIGQGLGVGFLVKLVDSDIGVLREYLREADKLSREVWLSDGNTVTPEFIRTFLVRNVFAAIAAHRGAISQNLELLALRTGPGVTRTGPALHHLAHEMGHLQNEIATRYEIEAVELAKQQSQVSRVKQAPSPPRVVGGLGIVPAVRRPTQIPPEFPVYYPNDLKPRTHVILAKAVRDFPEQAQALDLCRHVISEMTPVFRKAVEDGILRQDQALSDAGMAGLLHSLLVYNCDNDNQRFRLGQEARKSDEWLRFAETIADSCGQRRADTSDGKSTTSDNRDGTEQTRSAGFISKLERQAFAHSDDYRSVVLSGNGFTLTPRQAQIIQILHKAHENGTPELGAEFILEEIGSPSSRLRDSFKSNQEAWKALVKLGKMKGTIRLNV